ncbi:MAG TPA: bifunctional 5,10-methylenetetrahydrofolate dehydrogenase/5,10-methenyltetrahydrofolate cyclohydrolase [Thermodesulfobacteriota bacterium]|nr:bifunctional 5,10-methylenetetrahydrofolate dehydrogenase/5,10-methenyltetrahydrofolate cyclohydrolase [Thermodesulfobacteriota bacterium]
MKIDGKTIAQEILDGLRLQVEELKKEGITPTLAIILIGSDEASQSYIKQKQLKGEEIGADVKVFHFDTTSEKDLLSLIEKLNKDPKIHGMIVQRPIPEDFDRNKVSEAVSPEKDVDGFNSESKIDAPVAEAVMQILQEIGENDLAKKRIAVIGKGETAGGPIIKLLQETGARPEVIDRETPDPDEIIKNAEIVISAVGKEGIVNPEILGPNQVLVGLGLYMGEDGKLHGDYKDEEVEGRVKYFTPKLGGVGPVNVAFLMHNLVEAAKNQTK